MARRLNSYGLTQRARNDLFDIFVYGCDQFGETQAEAYAAGFEHVFQLLADNPGLGRKAEGIASGAQRHEHGSHVILYEEAPFGIMILAIVHGSSVQRLAL
ncbi:type II toxin-antitoxin system RelE/ParE family toxin [Bosea sp. (in: a-proteobacteria)]|jgi:toxin ParE1/3/4|uniref:type II toxin-antitoxin system RelE/ParE family toxin n=1 Tax=Bosea sp. (in: a-proteobacteria) TaxID=1871050 RepID=UPI00356A7F9F